MGVGLLMCLAWGKAAACAEDGNRLVHLDHPCDPYYVGREFPKLTTPQWVGEEGVEAVVVLAIDDMRDTARYEAYLRPILERLKAIDGRAPVSIMTCRVDPADPQLKRWLDEGLSIEVHTFDHPCPLLKDGDFDKAKGTYDRCVDLLHEIPGNRPVAFRMPCCDSLNTVSPRFFTQIYGRETPQRHHLQIDSSVFQLFTPDDPSLPAEIVREGQRERFRKYIPFPSFVNWITDYPYPYVIAGNCWEFPCMVPSDWEAQNLQRPFNPKTVEDMKTALDATVIKQGVFNLVFHPHGWIRAEQVVELIDHAERKHPGKVRFLTFAEALQRINKHMLDGHPLRPQPDESRLVRLVDIDDDGYQDVMYTTSDLHLVTKVWRPEGRKWDKWTQQLTPLAPRLLADRGRATEMLYFLPSRKPQWAVWSDDAWQVDNVAADAEVLETLGADNLLAVQFRDLDGDGRCEMLTQTGETTAVSVRSGEGRWTPATYRLPDGVRLVSERGGDAGLRWVDVDGDGLDDCLLSDAKRYSLHLTRTEPTRWVEVVAADRGETDAEKPIPPLIRPDGTSAGAWFHSQHLWLQNEDTARLPDLVDRMSFAQLLGLGEVKEKRPDKRPEQGSEQAPDKAPEKPRPRPPGKAAPDPPPQDPATSLKAIQVAPGFEVRLAAAEPLVADPVAFDWDTEGRLWVVEMPDYPNGMAWNGPGDPKGDPGGRVKRLTDDDGDGVYDRAELFADELPFPTAIKVWGEGVLVAAAPDILYLEDTDGDGKADRREQRFTGFTPGNQQHRVNGLRWGLDGMLHLANGDSGGQVHALYADSEAVDIGGRDLAIDGLGLAMTTLSGKTQFGRCRNDWGDWFGGNNSNPIWHYALEERYLVRNPHVATPSPRLNVPRRPGAAPVYPISKTLPRFNDFDKANRFTSACSPEFYRDAELPGLAGHVFVCEPVHNLVSRQAVSREGLRFVARRVESEQESEFLASADNWFRPVMIRTGPDGALWIADMYRYVIEHPEWIPEKTQRSLDMRAGADRGRIYRVVPVGKQLAMPRMDGDTPAELAARLESSNGWVRDTAHEHLLRLGPKAPKDELARLARQGGSPAARLHALCALAGLDAVTGELLLAAAADPHEGVRRWAVRLAESSDDPELVAEMLRLLADEAAPPVIQQLLYTLGPWSTVDGRAAAVLADLALRHGADEMMRAAAVSSINETNGPAVLLGWLEAASRNPAPATAEPLVAAAMRALAGQGQLEELTRLTASLADSDQFSQGQTIRVAADLLEALGDHDVQLAEGQRSRLVAKVRPLAARRGESQAEAVRLLGLASRLPDDAARLGSLLSPAETPAVQLQAAAALGAMGTDEAAEQLLGAWARHSPRVRSRALDLVLQRPSWTRRLLQMVSAEEIPVTHLDARRREQLLQHEDAEVRQLAADSLTSPESSDRAQVVRRYLSRLPRSTDAKRGRMLFENKCASCHRLHEVGKPVGPDLAALKDRSPEAMLVAILDPNRAVEEKYGDYIVATEDGRQFSGVLIDETGTSITLLGPDAQRHQLLREQIVRMRATGRSLMPEGLERDLAPQDIADLLAFVLAKRR